MRTTMGIACSLVLLAGLARADGVAPVPGQVELGTPADIKALCADLRGEPTAQQAIYVARVVGQGYQLAPYDARKGRLAVDGKKLLTGKGFELAVQGGLELAMPVTPGEAERLIKGRATGTVALWVWFRSAGLPGKVGRCVTAISGGQEMMRLGVTPVAFAFEQGGEVLVEGQNAEVAAMRAPEPTEAQKVSVGAVMLGEDRGAAPDGVSRAVRGQERALGKCLGGGTGTVVVAMELGDGGKVLGTRVELDGVGGGQAASCVTEVLGRTSFGKKTRAVRISVPVSFE